MLNHALIESMESRTLMSAAPTLYSLTVQKDRLVVQTKLLKFQIDELSGAAKLLVDTQNIKKALAKGDTSLVAAFTQYRMDNKALGLALREDRLVESAAALADESVIKLDILQILKDKGNATAETADHSKLAGDRVTLQGDLIAGINSRIMTRQDAQTTIANDTAAIVTAADNDTTDPNQTALMAAVNAFSTDRNAKLATLTSDLAAVEAARTQLMTDLGNEQS